MRRLAIIWAGLARGRVASQILSGRCQTLTTTTTSHRESLSQIYPPLVSRLLMHSIILKSFAEARGIDFPSLAERTTQS